MGSQLQPIRLVAQLSAALRLLADAPDGQRAWLARYLRDPRAGTDGDFRVDELALQFEDAAQALPHFIEDGLLGKEQERAVSAVSEQLSSMRDARHARLWCADALGADTAWVEVRRRAAVALAKLVASPSAFGAPEE